MNVPGDKLANAAHQGSRYLKLTSYFNFMLRVLMVAAAWFPGLTTIGEMAEGLGVSKMHLVKRTHRLGGWD